MKKKVLFMIGTLQSGGVSKSLVSLLNVFDRQRYDVHLLLISRSGDIFSSYLPKDVTVHLNKDIEDLHDGFTGVFRLLKRFRLFLALGSIMRMVLSCIDRSKAGLLLAKLMPCFTHEDFDLIVDYGGQQQLYYMVDKLNGKKKISFFHSDYNKWPYYYNADRDYYPKIDAIFTISETSVKSMKERFPNCCNKIFLMENISVPTIIQQLSMKAVELPKYGTLFVTIGHVLKNKGIDLAIEAAEILKNRRLDFKWLFIGKIIEKKWVKKVNEKKLNNNLVFMGVLDNPYPYLRLCDIYVHPSRFEGKSIALDEAKILCKPIVVTNFSTVYDQFTHSVNASICEMTGIRLADAIWDLINNDERRQSYISYLNANVIDNSSEVKKLYSFLEN